MAAFWFVLVALAGATVGPDAELQTTAQALPPRDRIVVVISLDGFNPDALSELGASGTPALHRMIREGAATLGARTAYELTDTLPNHTGMMTGRPVSGRRGHHVTFNSDSGQHLSAVAGHYVRSLYDVAHDRGLGTALYTGKAKFAFFDRSWGPRWGARDRVGYDNGRDKIGGFDVDTDADRLVTAFDHRLGTAPKRLSFLHIALPDIAGHAHGFMSAAYLRAVQHTDALVGRVLHTIDTHPWVRARTDVILTADHGGKGPSHRDPTRFYNYRIPFIVWGRDAAAHADLYALNPHRERPGYTRPTYAGRQPIRNMDVANLAMDLLGEPLVTGTPLPWMGVLHVR